MNGRSLLPVTLVVVAILLGCSSNSSPSTCCYSSAEGSSAFTCACGTTSGADSCSVSTSTGNSCEITCTNGKYAGRIVASCAPGANSSDGG